MCGEGGGGLSQRKIINQEIATQAVRLPEDNFCRQFRIAYAIGCSSLSDAHFNHPCFLHISNHEHTLNYAQDPRRTRGLVDKILTMHVKIYHFLVILMIRFEYLEHVFGKQAPR